MENILTVQLSATGNPDHGQYGSIGIKTRRVPVKDMADAADTCRQFIEDEELGGGNWTGGQVYEDDRQIARVSFNGRVWDMDDMEIEI